MRRVGMVALLLGVGGCGGCGAPAASVLAADHGWRRVAEAEDEGDYAEARRLLLELAAEQPASERETLLLRACNTYDRAQDTAAASACYAELAPKLDDRERAAEARLHSERHQVAPAREAALEQLVIDFADTRTARRALTELRVHYRVAGNCELGPERLASVAARMGGASKAPGAEGWLPALRAEIGIWRARWLAADCDDPARALAALAEVEAPARATTWRDDWTFLAGELEGRLGRHEEALARFRAIIEATEQAWFFGSYDSLLLDDAYLAAGAELERLKRPAEARALYLDLVEQRPASRLVDDAEYRVAVLDDAAGDKGALARFVAKHPDSRHARTAREVLGARAP